MYYETNLKQLNTIRLDDCFTKDNDLAFMGEEKEWLALYAKRKLKEKHRDYFIFGHRHIPMEIKLNDNSTYINLGDWVSHYTYATYDGICLEIKKWVIN